jgi:hypothetical protein
MARGTSFLDVLAVIRPTVLVQRLIDTHTHARMDENVNKYKVWYHSLLNWAADGREW